MPQIKFTLEPQGIERGRTLTRISSVANKYGGAGANFRGRKSNSLMNLCGGKKNPLNETMLRVFSCRESGQIKYNQIAIARVPLGWDLLT